eukprot:1162137-Pelagomonas_calceolata.AAC.3
MKTLACAFGGTSKTGIGRPSYSACAYRCGLAWMQCTSCSYLRSADVPAGQDLSLLDGRDVVSLGGRNAAVDTLALLYPTGMRPLIQNDTADDVMPGCLCFLQDVSQLCGRNAAFDTKQFNS